MSEAARLFCDQGYPGTSMRDIADAVGLLPGSLYAHIDDKEGLLAEIVESGIDSFLAAAETVLDAPGPPDVRMRRLIRAHLGIIAGNVQQTTVVFHQWKHLGEPHQARVMEKRNRYESLFSTLVDEGMATGAFNAAHNPRITVLSILGILNWVPEWMAPGTPESIDEVAERLSDVILLGLGGARR